ncbi:MAG: MarR family transcriptional regulator [Candidatus Verstraetearchaeota archaeon]|jgi:DNA-binding MarR family transcriptional regulator|nr:MarR family transcriptional regulator [Candidatus Verstraetearchaeota archaeon]
MYTPQRYAVLEAIARGANSYSKISKLTGISIYNVLEIVNQLEAEGLIERKIKGFIFKKEVYELTSKGKIVLNEWREKAIADLKKAEELKEEGKEEEAKEILVPYMQILPFILTLDVFSFLALSELMMLISMTDILANDWNVEFY